MEKKEKRKGGNAQEKGKKTDKKKMESRNEINAKWGK
jgi:hypothetical protein